MRNLRYDNEQCQSVAYEKALYAAKEMVRLRRKYGARLKMKEARRETET